jgi:Tfp pilus assembly protein PilW
MCPNRKLKRQAGFSMMELMISLTTMTIVTGCAFALIGGSIKFTNTTYHMTDAEQTLRTAHEIIHRDLTTAGNGLRGVSAIKVPRAFVINYLTLAADVADPNNLALVVSDDNVPASTAVAQSSPAATVLGGSDRITMLSQDTSFNNGNTVSLAASQITVSGSNTNIAVGATNVGLFQAGEIYAVNTQVGMAFGVITSINTTTNTLIMTNGDVYGLNQTSSTAPIYQVAGLASGPSTPGSLMRMQIIHYYVNANNLLIRRVFGVRGVGFVDSVIAEHVVNLQFRYMLNKTDPNGFVYQPVTQVALADQTTVREVETTLAVETVRAVNVVTNSDNGHQRISTTTATTVRNLQFRKAL